MARNPLFLAARGDGGLRAILKNESREGEEALAFPRAEKEKTSPDNS
jgi:hypothetical protein